MLQQRANFTLLQLGVFAGAVDYDPAELGRLLLGTEDDLTRVRGRRDGVAEDGKGLGLLSSQPPRQPVGRVPEPVCDVLDAFAGLRLDPRAVHLVEGVRHRRHRDTCLQGDVTDRGLVLIHSSMFVRDGFVLRSRPNRFGSGCDCCSAAVSCRRHRAAPAAVSHVTRRVRRRRWMKPELSSRDPSGP